MQLSALLALLPLAAALPQSRGPVETRTVEVETRSSTQDECYAAYGNCCDPTKGKGPYTEGTNLEIMACIFGRGCRTALDECLGNATEKRSVQEAPVEDKCRTDLSNCSWKCPIYEWDEVAPAFTGPCHDKCNKAYQECTANQTAKPPVEEAPVETHKSTKDECYNAHADCCYPFEKGTYSEGRNLMIMACPGGRGRCQKVLDDCMANVTEKRSVEEAPIEARAVDNCGTDYVDCSHNCPIFEFGPIGPAYKGPCHSKCYENYQQCTANQTEKRSVEEALEARYVEDECDLQYDQCCHIPSNLGNEMRNGLAVHCPLQCYESLKECNAKQAEKRSVEKAAIQARDNGSEATTACFGNVASCKHKGTPVAECYSNLARCIQDVLQKFA